ncbi:Mov34/MPN/PAD-1 family protein [Niveispirillum lacus]
MKPEALEFRDPAGSGYAVWLSSGAVASVLAAADIAGGCETGGILIGRYDHGGWTAEVVEATPKPPGSHAGWSWFHRGDAGLRELLEARWAAGHHYLGEWHFHPGGATAPSDTDKRTMWRIAADAAYQCPQPVLVILGGTVRSRWSLSATVFQGGSYIQLREARRPVG